MNKSKKRGKLSLEEMGYIKQNCFDLSLEEMARQLNRTIEPIRKYIDKENLKARDLTDEEHLLSTIRSRYYFQELKKQFSDAELISFEHQWIDYFRQFNEDVTHTEEMQIVEVVRLEILLNRVLETQQNVDMNIQRLERLIDEAMEQPEDDQDPNVIAMLETQLGSYYGSKSTYVNEYDKLLNHKEKYFRDMKTTREQRKRVADDSKTNFSLWLRQLDNLKEKEKEGFDMEVQAIAADKARARLSEYHKYEDDEVDQPLLNSETLIDEDEDVSGDQAT